jgi:hypothetical protein
MAEEHPVLAGGQLSLLTSDQMAEVTEESCKAAEFKQGIYSGCRLKASDPDRYHLVVNLLASGRFSWREIRGATGVSMGLISGILKEQSHDIEAVKKNQAAESRVIAGMTNQAMTQWLIALLDDPDKIKALSAADFKNLQTAGAIATDKALVQTGQATQIIGELKHDGMSADDLQDYILDLSAADVEEMGFVGGNGEQKGAVDVLEAAGGADEAACGADEAGCEVVSSPSPAPSSPPSLTALDCGGNA